MGGLGQQLRYTIRKLLRAPMFSVVAVLTLAVGIGSNVAIFAVVNGVLLQPLPYPDPDRLVGLWHVAPALGFEQDRPINQAPGLHFTYADDSRAFESVGVWDNAQASVTGLAEPEQVDVLYVSFQVLPMLGAEPLIGRVFTEEDDTPETPQTVILSEGYWRDRFGGDRGVLGRTLTVNGVAREIVGVLPAEFGNWRVDPALYLPLRLDRTRAIVGNFSYQGVARLRPDATLASANADVDRMIPLAAERYPGAITPGMIREVGLAAYVIPLEQEVVGDVGSVLWVLLGTVGIVLLIACANVANLFIVRAEGRQREIAVRAALGAGRARVTAQLLLETLALGLAGGALGLAVAYAGLELLVRVGPETLPRLQEIGVDGAVLAFTLGLTLAASLLFGLLPALRFGRLSFATALKEGGRGGSAGKERHLARNALVVVQMALALVLLTGSGLMVRSFQSLRAVEPGFEAPEQVLTFRVAIPTAEIPEPLQVAQTHREILTRVQSIPGVAAAAMSSSITMDGWDNNNAVDVEDFPLQPDQIPPIRRYKFIGEGYHATMGNPLLAGRAIDWADIDAEARIAMVTENFAVEYWGSAAAAIGERIRDYSGEAGISDWYEIVGVVGDERDDGTSAEPVSTVYWPLVVRNFFGEELIAQRSMGFAVRARAVQPTNLLPQVREAVWSVNPNLPLARVRTLDEYVDESMARTSFTLLMLGTAAGVALFLGVVGIYGVISYVVSERTREIGVRMAMGAERGDIGRMVLRQAGSLAGLGVILGLVAAAGLTRLMGSLLYGVSPMDPVTFAAVSATLALVALVASWIPARRAAGVDPVVALRFE